MPLITEDITTDHSEPNRTAPAPVESGPVTVPEQSRGDRRTSFDPSDFAVPNGREEDWRFTPVDRIQMLFTEPAPDAGTAGDLTWESSLPGGVTLGPVSTQDARTLGISPPGDRPAALAVAQAPAAALLNIPPEADLAAPVRIGLTGTGAQVVWGHLVIRAGRHARGLVILEHRGTTRLSDVVSIVADDGAQLTVVTLQEWDDRSLHLSEHDVVVGRDATVRHIAVTLGGQVVRLSVNARYTGPGGSFEGLGVYFADDGQHLEHRLFVDHEVPRCASHVTYKGALSGQTAHTVWVGDVLIRAAAEGTDTYELNRNLVLSDGARADSVPNLEIETGEIVGAGHASATGRFDDEQLFYLQSRGIPSEEARRLVVRGFFADIINRIGVPEVTDRLMSAIDTELDPELDAKSETEWDATQHAGTQEEPG